MLAPSIWAAMLPKDAGSMASRNKAGAWLRHSKSIARHTFVIGILFVSSIGWLQAAPAKKGAANKPAAVKLDFDALRLAIEDLAKSFPEEYTNAPEYLARLAKIEADARRDAAQVGLAARLGALRSEALLANPLIDFDRLILLKRKRGQLGLPVNHKCNSGIAPDGYDNEIAVLSPVAPNGKISTLYRPTGTEYVGEIDLEWDADRLLFTMPVGKTWQIHEIGIDGSGLRQVSRGDDPDVDNFDACYLPDGRIVFNSTASFHAVPCWHGKERACNLYLMDADGGNVRQLCFDQDLDLHPAVLPSGQVIYSRWDYSGTMHIYLRPLMVMNPDGSGQRAVYGSNSYWPNALYYPRGIPESPNKLVAIIAGYHGVPRMGELCIIDLTRGWHEADGVVQRIPGRGKPIEPIIRDRLVDNSWPKFLHPFPLSEKHFLVAMQPNAKAPWGIYLVDVFDNIVPVRVQPEFDLFEPIPVRKQPRPPIIPDRIDTTRNDAIVYLQDVYAGPGLAGVPRGTIKSLRIAAYHFGYPGMAGPDKVGCGGPWEVMRILGTVPIHEDGSAMFRVPANTPLCVQALDSEGKAVQLMRSWYTAMPGEAISCVGCHEQPRDVPVSRNTIASSLPPSDITPWYGPARGFDFEREVQPVLDMHCVRCHDGTPSPNGVERFDLRAERFFPDYKGRLLTQLGQDRLHPDAVAFLGGKSIRYTPAYEALIPYIRRVNIEDGVGLLVPGEYHADTSELIQMLKKGHFGVRLDAESWDRLVTWIDLNGPCHGTWNDVCPVPENADKRRRELANRYGGPPVDPEDIPNSSIPEVDPAKQQPTSNAPPQSKIENPKSKIPNWPFSADEARRRQAALGSTEKKIDLGDGIAIKLRRIPAGDFVMGSDDGEADETPAEPVSIERDFWIAECEITNAQLHQFDPDHNSGLFTKRFQGPDGPGLSLRGPDAPAVRVSWEKAKAYCAWLSRKTGMRVDLPTEAQWEYACRAGAETTFNYGDLDADFSRHANLADKALSVPPRPTGGLESNIVAHFGKGIFLSAIFGGNILCDVRCDDKAIATAEVGRYQPNAWGLHDMHGNVAEWTRSNYIPYTLRDETFHNAAAFGKVVRGGSWVDRPMRARSAFRLAYPAWQRPHNVGFRIIAEDAPAAVASAGR